MKQKVKPKIKSKKQSENDNPFDLAYSPAARIEQIDHLIANGLISDKNEALEMLGIDTSKYMKKKVIKKKASSFRCMSCNGLCKTKEKWREITNVKCAVCAPCAKIIDAINKVAAKIARIVDPTDKAIATVELLTKTAGIRPTLFLALMESKRKIAKK